MTDPAVDDNPAEHRFEVRVDDQVAGFAAYRDRDGVRSFTHTEIDDAFEGRGLGSLLVRTALERTRDAGLSVLPYCPFVRSYLARHPELLDLVPGNQRTRFDLPES